LADPMSQDSTGTTRSTFLRADSYKPNQGRLARRLTGGIVAVIGFFGAWSLHSSYLADSTAEWVLAIPFAVFLIGLWFAYRIINQPKFADFLISTESEVEKVNWPDRQYVHRATIVVIVTMLVMGAMLFLFDLVWQTLFEAIGFLDLSPEDSKEAAKAAAGK
jgi:preprotein translocase subunit SecE